MTIIRDAWLWYRQYPAIWAHDAMYYFGFPFSWCIWPLSWAGVGYCADDFRGFRRFLREHPEDSA